MILSATWVLWEQMVKQLLFFGSGIDAIFPTENVSLAEKIVNSGGLILSEYEPDVEWKSQHFPVRNRIVSGISAGVLVVESAYRSGASLTANIATSQGKPVFCIPRDINNKYIGNNILIKHGAFLVTDYTDILNTLGLPYNEAPSSESIHNNSVLEHTSNSSESMVSSGKIVVDIPDFVTNMPSGYKEVYLLLLQKELSINEICKATSKDISSVSSILTILELEGHIKSLPGKMFKV